MKDPWFAVMLSYFIPGLGQIYGGRPIRGVILLVLYLVCLGLAAYLLFARGTDSLLGFGVAIVAVCVFLANLVEAHRAVPKSADSQPAEAVTNPWLAGFLTYVAPGFFLPGVGQIYGKRYIPGVLLLAAGVGIFAASSILKALILPLHHLTRAVGLWHAQWSLSVPRKALSSRFLILIPLMVAEGGVMSAALMWAPQNVLQMAPIRGSGMEPVLADGDWVLIDRRGYLEREPARGDIVLYRMAKGGGTLLARVVGLPGEEVQVREGRLLVKGERVPGPAHPLPEGDWGSLNLPAGRYLLIADNARLNLESGLPPPVERQAILGEVYKRIFPLGRRGNLDGPPTGD